MQSNRRRSLPAVAIAQTERWIQDTQAEDNKDYLSNTAATEDVNELPAVRTRKTQKKSWHIVLFDRRKRLLLRLQRKSEEIKNLMENKCNVRPVYEELEQHDDLLKLFSEVEIDYHGKLDDDQRKLIIFGLIKLIKKSLSLSMLYIITCKETKRSCQGDLEHLGKLNHKDQVLALSLESMENKSRSKLLMKKSILLNQKS